MPTQLTSTKNRLIILFGGFGFCTLLLLVASLSQLHSQLFEIESISVESGEAIVIKHSVEAEHYYLLIQGDEVTEITTAVDAALVEGNSGEFRDTGPLPDRRFYQIQQVPINAPLDTDGDGIDDYYELERSNILDPLNASDAGLDPDNNQLTHLEEYQLTFTTRATISPPNGTDGVAVTRETIIYLNNPLADDISDLEDAVYAEFSGQRLGARIEIGIDRKSITLFYDENLPDGARISLTLNGDLLADDKDRLLDADEDGQPGGLGQFSFTTLSLATIPNTAVIGTVYASELAEDNGELIKVPLEGVTIFLDGREQEVSTTTDADGNFKLEPVPAGEFFVHVYGRTEVNSSYPWGEYYATVGKAWNSVPGRDDTLAGGTGEIYLPLIYANSLEWVSNTQDTEIEFIPQILEDFPELEGVSVTVPANSLFDDDGSRGGRVGIAPVSPERLPEPLPEMLQFPLVITVQTDGAENFSVPAPVRFPNLPDPVTGELLPPGAKTGLWSFNHDSGKWELQGPMTISEDGLFAVSDPGVGILAPGWHGTNPGSWGSGGGGGGPGGPPGSGEGEGEGEGDDEDDDDDEEKEDPCDTLRKLAISATAQCAYGLYGPDGCAGSIIGGVGGAVADCTIEFSTCESTILSQTFTTLLGCVPVIGGPASLAWDCLLGAGTANNKYESCLKFPDQFSDTEPLFNQAFFKNQVDEDIPLDPILAQQRLWEDASELGALLLGNPRWTMITSEEWTKAEDIFEFLQVFTTEESEDAAGLSSEEQAVILELPRPSNINEADILALLDRFDRLNRKQLSREELNIDAIKLASDKYTETATELESRGWQDPHHGVTTVLLQLANEQNQAFNAGGSGNLNTLSSPANTSSRTPYSLRGNLYYLLTNLDNRFEQRGRLDSNGRFSGLILVPDNLYQVEYADPTVGQTGTTAFMSGSAGTSVIIPKSILGSDDSADSDNDGLSDQIEKVIGTNSSNPDSDNDGISDGGEIQQGTNPLDGFPAVTGIIAASTIPGTGIDVVNLNDLTLTASQDAGVFILSAPPGESPLVIANVLTDGPAIGIDASDTHAVAAVSGFGAQLMDISNPTNPTVTKSFELGTAQDAVIDGDYVYIASGSDIILYHILSDSILNQRTYSDMDITDLQVAFGHLYMVSATSNSGGKHRLQKIPLRANLEDPVADIEIASSPFGTGEMNLAVGNGVVYLGLVRVDAVPGLEIISDDENGFSLVGTPTPVTVFDVAPTGSGHLVFNGATLNLLADADLGILDVSDPSKTDQLLSAYDAQGGIWSVNIHNGLAFATDNAVGLQVINFLSADTDGVPPSLEVSHDAGPQLRVEAGGRLRVTTLATDDVQVRNVEFFDDQTLIFSDGNFPFEHNYRVPEKTSEKTEMIVRVRATDMGGNSTWSDDLALELLEDATPPEVLEVDPEEASIWPSGSVTTLEFVFSEGLTESTLNTDTLQLFAAGADTLLGTEDDTIIGNGVTSFNSETNTASLTFNTGLGAEKYRMQLQPAITDLFGNLMGESFSSDFEVMDPVDWLTDENGLWSDGSKWSTSSPPETNDLVTIDRSDGDFTITHASGNTDIAKLISAESFILSGGTLTLQQTSSIGGAFTMSGGSRSGPAELTVQGPFTWTGGTFDGAGITRFASGMDLGDSTGFVLGDHTLINEGLTTIAADFLFSIPESTFINESSGTVNIDLSIDRNIPGPGPTAPFPLFKNLGTVNKLQDTIISFNDVDLENDGLIDIQSGTLNLNESSRHTGGIQVAAGTELGFQSGPHRLLGDGELSGPGTIRFGHQSDFKSFDANYAITGATIVDGGTIEINGPASINEGSLTVNKGKITFTNPSTTLAGPIVLSGSIGSNAEAHFSQGETTVMPSSLTLSDYGILGGSGIVAPVETIEWTGGTMTGTGTTRAGAGINMNNASILAIRESRILEIGGDTEWTGAGDIQFEPDARILNLEGATFGIRNDKRIYSFTGSGGIFENHGTLVKSVGAGTTDIDVDFSSPGNVDVQSGRLDFGRETEFGGLFKLAAGTISELGGNPNTFTGESSVESEGKIIFRSFATVEGSYNSAITEIRMGPTIEVTFNGDASSDLTEFKAGTLGGTGTYTIIETMDWLSGSMSGSGTTRNNGTINMQGDSFTYLSDSRVLENAGMIVWTDSFMIASDGSKLHNLSEGTIDFQSDDGISDGGGDEDPMILNEGLLKKSGGIGNSNFNLPVVNAGTVEAISGKLRFMADYHQSAGVTRLAGGSIFGPSNKLFEIEGGSVTGSGDIEAPVTNSGTFAPGASAGKLTVTGDFTQTTGGALQIEIGGTTVETEYDQLHVSGPASLAGTLSISLINDFDPAIDATFEILTAGSRTGEFETLQGLSIGGGKTFSVEYSEIGITLKVISAP